MRTEYGHIILLSLHQSATEVDHVYLNKDTYAYTSTSPTSSNVWCALMVHGEKRGCMVYFSRRQE